MNDWQKFQESFIGDPMKDWWMVLLAITFFCGVFALAYWRSEI